MDPYLVIAGGGARRMLTQDLDRMKDRCSALEAPLQQAADALGAARATFEALRDEYNAANEQRQALQRSLVRAIIGAVPSEILRAIFDQAAIVMQPTDSDVAYGNYNRPRAVLPFMLSGVCKRWRDVVLAHTALWAYISWPNDVAISAQEGFVLLPRVRMLLKRSKSCPLDIIIACPKEYDRSRFDWFYDILRELAKHVHRWRRVSLMLSESVTTNDVSFLRHPTPLLEQLILNDRAQAMVPWTAPFPVFLPDCRVLRNLTLGTTFIRPVQSLTSLVELNMSVDEESYESLWETLAKLPRVKELSVNFLDNLVDIYPPFSRPLHIPSLTHLGLTGEISVTADWKDILFVPNIQSLQLMIKSAHLALDAMPFFEATCTAITELQLRGSQFDEVTVESDAVSPEITVDFMPLFLACNRVRDLTLFNCRIEDDAFFSAPPAGDSVLMPAVRSITLTDVEVSDGGADSLCGFIRRRALLDEQDPLHVTLDDWGGDRVPPWLERQLRSVLGDRFTFNPPPEGAEVESAATESEARFTHSDDASAGSSPDAAEDDSAEDEEYTGDM